ncbi:MAG: ROK family transcriptional regulator [Spirochaetales bacterium]|nr:ROK family transcriptional regulator [Spirochaetales bacterium]
MAQEQRNRHRHDNTIRVLEALWRHTGMSRAQLARTLRLDRSTIGSIIDQLLSMRLVTESDRPIASHTRGAAGGRPPVSLAIAPDCGFSIGIELSSRLITVVATDLAGAVVGQRNVEFESTKHPSKSVIEAIRALATETSRRIPAGPLAVAVGVPGIVDAHGDAIILSRELNVTKKMPLASHVSDELDVPVWLLNDADACAVGEIEYGDAGRGRDMLVGLVRYRADPRAVHACLGIVLDGHLREARTGAGREFRSPFVPRSSVDQFAVAEQYRAGRFDSRLRLEEAFADELAASISFLVHALDLRRIVLGGDVIEGELDYDLFDSRLRRRVSRDTARVDDQPLEVRRPTQPAHSVAWGASAAAIRRLFETRYFPVRYPRTAPLARQKVTQGGTSA